MSEARLSQNLDSAAINEVIDMAMSDHVAFDHIEALHGLSRDEVKAVMRANLKPKRYKAWRQRLRTFAERREHYK